MKINRDSFGFENQGQNYRKFRPQYPQPFYQQTLATLSCKNKYLDIAMGTGQLLFNIAPQFHSSKGIDISDKMLQAAQTHLAGQLSSLKDKIRIQKCDVMDLPQNQKFDLITIGQALHWLSVRESLQKMKNILKPDGKLLIISYIVKGLQDQSQDRIYQTFYEQTKQMMPDFPFNRDEMHRHYSEQQKYPFQDLFQNVQRSSQDINITMPKTAYVSYMKTYAGYNQLMAKNLIIPDPIQSVQDDTLGDQVTLIIDYFKIQCWN